MMRRKFAKLSLLSITASFIASCGSSDTSDNVALNDDNLDNAQTSVALSGEAIYNQCKACHTIGKDERNIIGPNLWGIVGRSIAEKTDFTYSKALIEKGGVWDEAALDAFLESPQGFASGNKMSFSGIRDADKRNALIEYLSQQSE